MKIKKVTSVKSESKKRLYKTGKKEPSKYFMAEGDYSGFQMRIAAVLSGDENLKYAFSDLGGDVHSSTACAIFHPNMEVLDFMEHKKEEPFKSQRAIAKGVNFQFLFGGAAWSFANDVLKQEWTLTECLDFLTNANLNTKSDQPYLVAAEYLRNSYFLKYPKLKTWHESCHQEARTTGMIRSAFGVRRLLPRLLYIGSDSDQRDIAEDQNISKNSIVQNFESAVIIRAMREFNIFVKENNMKSKIFGMIHDAVEFYIYKEEREILVPKILEFFQRDYEEFQKVSMVFELEISDVSKGEVWGFGKEVTT